MTRALGMVSWESYELVWRDSTGTYSRMPFSDALAGSSEALRVLKLISRVEDLGWPEARMLTYGKKGKRRIVSKDGIIYLLKCVPDCWRLYLYVKEKDRRFVYVHAVCKRRDAEDPGDAVTARQHYDTRAEGGLRRITFPPAGGNRKT